MSRGGSGPRDPELSREQAYADWIQEEIDRMIGAAKSMLDAADTVTYKAIRKNSENRCEELEANREGVLVGRLDMESEETFYIGKLLVDGGDIDRPSLINWRAPFAERFFQATPADNQEIGRRRTIAMRGREVTGYSDEVLVAGFKVAEPELVVPDPPKVEPKGRTKVEEQLDREEEQVAPTESTVEEPELLPLDEEVLDTPREEPDVSDETLESLGEEDDPGTDKESPLRASDLLLEELERHRSGAMGEIVATIQADQDRLIRSDPQFPLVIQGGPGTGKTVVALHRAAWVLFQHREDSEQPTVLVVGPNERFVQYISGVLPSLGEHNVVQLSVAGVCRMALTKGERKRINPQRSEPPDAARLKGDPEMIELVARAVWLHAAPAALEVGHGRFILRVSEERVRELLEGLWQRRVPYARVKEQLREAVIRGLAGQLRERTTVESGTLADVQLLESDARRAMKETRFLESCVPAVTPRAALFRLFTDDDFRARCGAHLDAESVALLAIGIHGGGRRYRWSEEDMPLLDEAAVVINGRPPAFTHVVIDEAQDLSPMAWRAIRRRTRAGAVTIAGDLAQATSSWSPGSWDEVAERAELGKDGLFAELKLGYRVPEQVMLFAGRLLPSAAPTTGLPRSFRTSQAPVVLRAEGTIETAVTGLLDGRGELEGSVAVIVPPALESSLRRACARFDSDVLVLDGSAAKGLEFDHVIVVEPADIAEDGALGLRRLYIALTRCTQTLTVVHSKPLPTALALDVDEDQVRADVRKARLKNLRRSLGRRAATSVVHPRSYLRWSTEEEEDLRRRVDTGLSLEEVADLHQRTPRSVLRRLKKLGVDAPPSNQSS